MVKRLKPLLAVAVLLGLALTAAAQDFGFGGGFRGPFRLFPNTPYDGRFTFARIEYATQPGGYWYGGWPTWGHGYPLSEQNLMRIMNEISYLGAHDDQVNHLTLDDPDLGKYPVAYIIEVAWWEPTDREIAGLRAYLQKGGFVIVDDFKRNGSRGDGGWDYFEANMRRILPGARFFDMKASDPIFHTFFEIKSLDIVPQAYVQGRPIFRGLYENNDPNGRLEMIVNYNTDVSQFWEWSGTGLRPIDDTNEAYKLGVNYVMYGLTH